MLNKIYLQNMNNKKNAFNYKINLIIINKINEYIIFIKFSLKNKL